MELLLVGTTPVHQLLPVNQSVLVLPVQVRDPLVPVTVVGSVLLVAVAVVTHTRLLVITTFT
jgi:hypothetical protein